MPELLTIDELAGLLKISKTTAYRLIDKRLIPFYKVKGGIRFDRKDIMDYLRQNRVEPVGLMQYLIWQ